MSLWQIEPRDPLVLRDGPTDPGGAFLPSSLPLPWPSSTAGLMRHRAGLGADGAFDRQQTERVRELPVRGPWLASLDDLGDLEKVWLPAPADSLWLRADSGEPTTIVRMAPKPRPGDLQCNLPDALQPVMPLSTQRGAPRPAGRAYWSWDRMARWLTDPQDREVVGANAQDFDAGPSLDRRMHVVIDKNTGTAVEGGLFQTAGRVFDTRHQAEAERGRRRVLLVDCDDQAIEGGVVFLGGERRQSVMSRSRIEPPALPAGVGKNGARLRLILTTPGIFDLGYRPSEFPGGAKLIAAAVGRPDSISGWDFERNEPKACRQMAPAGSVYWVELPSAEDPRAWAEQLWLQSICSEPTDADSGFGLVMIGNAP